MLLVSLKTRINTGDKRINILSFDFKLRIIALFINTTDKKDRTRFIQKRKGT